MTNITDNDFTEITFNDATNLWSLWVNGKIVKTAFYQETLNKILRG